MTVEIRFAKHTVRPAKGETVLDAFERSGISIPYSCRVGVCHFCLLKATDGTVPPKSQEGLDSKLKDSGHFKSCVCYPEESLTCEPAHSASFRDFVKIHSIEPLGTDIVKVSFSRPGAFNYAPGQFATFQFEDGHARSYSIASLYSSESTSFDIHVRKISNGRMSSWFHHNAKPGDSLWMEGPKGECTYRRDFPNEDLLLVGTGTGMAPLYAILLDAIQNGHQGVIQIIQGALSKERLYLTDKLRKIELENNNIEYQSCVLNGAESSEITVGDLRNIALNAVSSTKNLRIYLCGDPGLVRHLKKHFFLAGASLKKIHVDPFIGTELQA